MRARGWAGAICVLLGGCSAVTGPDHSDAPALIRFAGEDARILAPDTVRTGDAFVISILTFAGGCTREVARTELDRSNGVEIRPFNRTRTARGGQCTADLITVRHDVTLRFDAANDYVIRFRGVNSGQETAWHTVEWVRDRIIRVRGP